MNRKIPEVLESSERKINNYQNSINEFRREKSDTEATINKLKEEITRQEVRKKELSDNILLRKTHESTKNLKQECLSLKEKLSVTNYALILEKWKNLQNQEEILLRQVKYYRRCLCN